MNQLPFVLVQHVLRGDYNAVALSETKMVDCVLQVFESSPLYLPSLDN
jgi:hypothetical protein